MPYHIRPLTYAIDNWHQLVNAISNTDPTLKIRVSDFVNSDILQGTRIEVIHPQYGVLFACMTNTSGRLTSWDTGAQLTTQNIITALAQLGFDIIFKTHIQVTIPTREFLDAAKNAGYTHIRRIIYKKYNNEIGTFASKGLIVCFNEVTHPELLNQFIAPLTRLDADIMRVSPNNNPKLDFTWLLDIPMHINSVLTDNL